MNRSAIKGAAALAALVVTMAACSPVPPTSPVDSSPSAVSSSEPGETVPGPGTPAVPGAHGPGVPATVMLPVTRTVSLPSSSGPRTAIVHHPAAARPSMPLVVVLHGAFGTAEQTRGVTGWDALADREGFVVAYPNGFGRTWNAGRCCGPAHAHNVDDVAFLHDLSEHLVEKDGVDRHRVYAVGMSNGAMMVYAWACDRPADLAGIGPVAGALVSDCQADPPMNVVALHGTADRNVPIRGGIGPRSVTRYNYPNLAASIAPFLAGDRCTPAPRRNDHAPLHISTFNCAAGAAVTVAVVDGLDHEWPGSKPVDPVRKLIVEKVAPPPLDATTFLWSHLRSASTIS